MSFLNKEYTFVKQENFDGFLKSIGTPDDKIPQILKFTPGQKLVKDGANSYTYFTANGDGPKVVKFQSGVEFDDVIGAEKTPIKTTYTVDGNTVTQILKHPIGNATFKGEYNADELVLTITTDKWDGVAKRYYKAA